MNANRFQHFSSVTPILRHSIQQVCLRPNHCMQKGPPSLRLRPGPLCGSDALTRADVPHSVAGKSRDGGPRLERMPLGMRQARHRPSNGNQHSPQRAGPACAATCRFRLWLAARTPAGRLRREALEIIFWQGKAAELHVSGTCGPRLTALSLAMPSSLQDTPGSAA
jgi:hypothetical protein